MAKALVGSALARQRFFTGYASLVVKSSVKPEHSRSALSDGLQLQEFVSPFGGNVLDCNDGRCPINQA